MGFPSVVILGKVLNIGTFEEEKGLSITSAQRDNFRTKEK